MTFFFPDTQLFYVLYSRNIQRKIPLSLYSQGSSQIWVKRRNYSWIKLYCSHLSCQRQHKFLLLWSRQNNQTKRSWLPLNHFQLTLKLQTFLKWFLQAKIPVSLHCACHCVFSSPSVRFHLLLMPMAEHSCPFTLVGKPFGSDVGKARWITLRHP